MTADLPITGEISLTNLAEKMHMPLDKTAAWQTPPAAMEFRGIVYDETVEAARNRTPLTDNAIRGAIQRGVVRAIKIRDWPTMVVSADVDKYVEAHR